MEKLAILGGTPAISNIPESLFKWPIITKEDEDAVLEVLRRGAMSNNDVTEKFEKEFADWLGVKHAVAYCNGTMSLQAAMFACGLSMGDEMIAPSKTYWASCIQAFNLGATLVFADIDEKTLCINPDDIERCIGPKTKAIMVVHYLAHPADMDRIMEIANKHNLYVIEDVSHAQGGLYKGRKLGTIGHVAAMSLMSAKSLAAGELGMLATNDRKLYERALAYSHYERNNGKYIQSEELKPFFSMPLGGMKGRVNQLASALGRVQLKYYDERIAEIDKSMNYFWDLLEGVPGIRAVRPEKGSGSTMGGWYAASGRYIAGELGGLPVELFCKAVTAEGFDTMSGANRPLHTHSVFNEFDLLGTGKPSRIAFSERDVRKLDVLPVTESVDTFFIPWFKHYEPKYIEQYANAFKKVAANYKELLDSGISYESVKGGWAFHNANKKKK